MKFRIKITLCMIWLMSLVFSIGGSFLISMSFYDSLEREKETAYSSYQMVLNTLKVVNTASEHSDYDDISDTLEQLSIQSSSMWSALRLTSDKELLYTDGSAANVLNDMSKQLDANHCLLSYAENTEGNRYLQLSGSFSAGEKTLYLDSAYDISSIYETRQLQQEAYQKIFIVMIFLCTILSYSISRVLTKPLSKLSKASREIASGNLSYRPSIYSNDEVGALASDFNNMVEKLELNVYELKDAMERQERFMGSFAHEMKTPMTSIIGYADLIRSQTLEPEEQSYAANYIFSEGKRLERLSLQLLDIIILKKKYITLYPAEPSNMIGKLVEYLQPIYTKKNITLQYTCEAGICLMEPDLVKSLLLNLLDNARKALDNGGTITIVSKMLQDGCCIQVTDNGKGIPPEALKHLTEAFYRIDKSRSREQGGVGLGLALCNEITALHKGTITFESKVDSGTTVTIILRGGRS